MKPLIGTALVLGMLVVGLLPVFAEEGAPPPDEPLVVNGEPVSPDLVCAGVDGAVVFDHGDTRYIAGFEGGPFLRVILGDGTVLESDDVSLRDDTSGDYPLGVLVGEIPEVRITLRLAAGLPDCPGL